VKFLQRVVLESLGNAQQMTEFDQRALAQAGLRLGTSLKPENGPGHAKPP
jgi:hypothetical protein